MWRLRGSVEVKGSPTVSAAPTISSLQEMAGGSTCNCTGVGFANPSSDRQSSTDSGTPRLAHADVSTCDIEA